MAIRKLLTSSAEKMVTTGLLLFKKHNLLALLRARCMFAAERSSDLLYLGYVEG